MSFIVGSPSNCRILLNSEPGHLINVNCMIMDSYINLNYGHLRISWRFLAAKVNRDWCSVSCFKKLCNFSFSGAQGTEFAVAAIAFC